MLNQKVIILTGASRGIGFAIAKYLLHDSHKLVLVARTAEPLEMLKREYPGAVEVFVGDLSDFEVCFSTDLLPGFHDAIGYGWSCHYLILIFYFGSL